jgi:hypothetical protein
LLFTSFGLSSCHRLLLFTSFGLSSCKQQ